MKDEDYNAVGGAGSSGKVHKVTTVKDHAGTHYVLACNKGFDLGIDGWTTWTKTTEPVTCKHCLGIREEQNKVWRITYYTAVGEMLYPNKSPETTKVVHLVAPNRTEAALLFGHNMPKDCAHSHIEVEKLTKTQLLKEKRML